MSVLCLGGAIVDLICEAPVADLADAPAFVPRCGGTAANVAVAAARAGARTALAGGAGEDAWGRWLAAQLAAEGVDVAFFVLRPDVQTALALVAVDDAGEPGYTVYGERTSGVVDALRGRVEAAVTGASGLVLTSNTLVDRDERELTMRARELALGHGIPVILDANLRLERWRTRADAAASVNACIRGALLVRANETEVRVMTGEDDLERAALSLVKAGARLVVVTLGADGAILRGELRANCAGIPVDVVSTMGAGDAFTGTLVAGLAASGFYPPAVAAGLASAVAAGAQACQRWGALD